MRLQSPTIQSGQTHQVNCWPQNIQNGLLPDYYSFVCLLSVSFTFITITYLYIVQSIAQDRLIWKQHAEAFAQHGTLRLHNDDDDFTFINRLSKLVSIYKHHFLKQNSRKFSLGKMDMYVSNFATQRDF